jgi:hypothetical protein
VIVSTDIGGSDPDDFQSMVHYLVFADLFDTEGLIASPPHAGRKEHILQAIEGYEVDYPKLAVQSTRFPTPDSLRAITKQGAVDPAPAVGYSVSTEGSRWIIERARADDPRPLWILVWGSITDVAQALRDDPGIKPKLRVYFISSWNRRMDPAARDYVEEQHPDLWMIEADTTFRGMYVGGLQEKDLGNRQFLAHHVKGHGALGDLLVRKKADIQMGDTPSVLYLLRGDPEDPTAGITTSSRLLNEIPKLRCGQTGLAAPVEDNLPRFPAARGCSGTSRWTGQQGRRIRSRRCVRCFRAGPRRRVRYGCGPPLGCSSCRTA